MSRQPIGIHGQTHAPTGPDPIPGISGGSSGSLYEIKVFSDTQLLSVAEGLFIFAIPSDLNGLHLTAVAAFVTTVSSSGLPTVGIRNVTGGVEMLSTSITIDVSEFTSYTAATPAIINVVNSAVSTGDRISVDCDVAGTSAKGLGAILTFS